MVDYTQQEEDWIIAQGLDSNFLVIQKLNEPRKRIDGKKASYLLEYRWLSIECEDEDDEAYVCVVGDEKQLYSKRELVELGVLNKNGKVKENINLFNHFTLF